MKQFRLLSMVLFMFTLQEILCAQAIKDEAKELKKAPVDKDTIMGWKYSGFFNLNFSQTSLNNWAAGGTGSYAILGTSNLSARYKSKNLVWENSLLLNYGMVKADGDALQKNDDRIELLSRFGRKASANWYYTGFTSFRTQFDATFDKGQLISNFMAPAWLQFAIGMTYSQDKNFSLLLAPFAGKFTFVRNQQLADAGSFGVKPAEFDPNNPDVMLRQGANFRQEIGAYLILNANYDVAKNVNLQTRLDLFNNYSDENKPNRKNIDVNWENHLNMKINKFLSTTFFTHLIYDQDILINLQDRPGEKGPRTQFKQVLGIGISYKFE